MPKNGKFDSAIQTYAWGVIRWRWLILLVTVLLVAAAASGGALPVVRYRLPRVLQQGQPAAQNL